MPAYASGLEFHLDAKEACTFYTRARDQGFTAFKFKVGHPELDWDLDRLRVLAEAVGPGATLMADANEAWSPKEAIRRLHTYRRAGSDLLWIEDPCLRDDYAGLARISREVPFTLVNAGEYLDLRGKIDLLGHGAVDVLNVHGHLTDSMTASRLAAVRGVPVSVGNTPPEIGVHVAAALPEVIALEYSFLGLEPLVDDPVRFDGGHALAPERPGHGLALSDTARAQLARPSPD